MTSKNAVSRNTLLQEMVKVKKLRFKELEERRHVPKVSKDFLQRRANFKEFKAVYEENIRRMSDSHVVHKTKSGILQSVKKDPQYVETINIELPLHFGADRAVQVIRNKIKPKKALPTPKVSRELITENEDTRSYQDSQSDLEKPVKSETIIQKLQDIEEEADLQKESNTNVAVRQFKEIQKHLKIRRDKIHKTLPKPMPVVRLSKKKPNDDKIMNTLSVINEKLQKMQEKYLNIPRVHYKNVNDCFTQSEDMEVLYENEKYPEQADNDSKNGLAKNEISSIDSVFSDQKMQERMKEMKEMFPEFPRIEDTLKEIECHLDKIVKLDHQDIVNDKVGLKFTDELEQMWNGGNLAQVLDALGKENQLKQDSIAEGILQKRSKNKDEKLRSIRQQIDEVEEFCLKLTEMAKPDRTREAISVINEECESPSGPDCRNNKQEPKKSPPIIDFMEGPNLESSIKKSCYLSKEFKKLSEYSTPPMIKIFSENRRPLWKDKFKDKINQNEDYSVESVTKMIDNLKFTLENSLYEPVAS